MGFFLSYIKDSAEELNMWPEPVEMNLLKGQKLLLMGDGCSFIWLLRTDRVFEITFKKLLKKHWKVIDARK